MPTRLIELAQASNWAIVPDKLDAIHQVLARHGDPGAWSREQGAGSGETDRPYQVLAGGVALIPVHGVIAKRMNLFSRFSGGTSAELIARDFQAALDDPEVRAILLDVDSPGGTVDGTEALAKRIFAARDIKPVVTFANGLMASAAYWIGSAGKIIITEETGEAGSIGVIQAHYDYSEADKQAGVKRSYIYAGKYKTAGNDAEPLSPESREYLQSGVDYVYSLFVDTVSRHRGTTIAEALSMAEGRIFIGEQARAAGLVDMIADFEAAHAIARDMGVKQYLFGNITKEEYIMATQPSTPTPITLARLEAELPELVTQIRQEGAASVDPAPVRAEAAQTERDQVLALASAYFGQVLADKFKALVIAGTTVEMYEAMKAAMPQAADGKAQANPDKMGEMLAAIQDAGAANPGPDALSKGPGSFEAAWQGIKAERNCSTTEAMKQAVRVYPDLHKAYLERFQGQAGRA